MRNEISIVEAKGVREAYKTLINGGGRGAEGGGQVEIKIQ